MNNQDIIDESKTPWEEKEQINFEDANDFHKALDKLEIGQVLEVLSTDPGSKRDIPAWANVTGQELISLDEKIPEEYRFIVKRLK